MATNQVKGAASKAKDTAGDAAGKAKDATTDTLASTFSGAVKEVMGPVVQQMGQQAAQRATDYAKEQGPTIIREHVMPQVMKSMGVDNPADLAKAGIGKVGDAISGGGGLTGLAGKVMSKFGRGGRGKGVATGYGQGRRIMIQQVQYIPVNVKDAYRAWTQSEWPQFMHRVNTLDRTTGEEQGEESRYSIGVKGLFFKKNFTAQVQEQVPFRFMVWSTTQGNIKNTGRVSFHGEGEDLTLMILNLDMAPSGLREKMVRGFRYHKRGIRSDFHRFSAWLQMRTQDELDELEGWLGTIEGGKIVQTHDEYVEEHPEEQDRGSDKTDDEQESEQDEEDFTEDEEEDDDTTDDEEDEDEEEEDEEDYDEEEEDEEPDESEDEEEEEEAAPEPPRRKRASSTPKRTSSSTQRRRSTSRR